MKKKQVSQWVKNFAQNYTVHKFLQNLYSTHYIFLYHTILSFNLLELMQCVHFCLDVAVYFAAAACGDSVVVTFLNSFWLPPPADCGK